MKMTLHRWRQILADPASRRAFVLTLLVPVAAAFLPAIMLPVFRAAWPVVGEQSPPLPPALDSLRVEEAYLNTRLEPAGQQQIGLAVDLVDSVLTLEVQGVPLRRVPLLDFSRSASFELARRQGRLSEAIGGAFTMTKADATIPRIPITVVEAPRDTAEARARPPAEVPDETGETHFVLRFDRGLLLIVNQPASAESLPARAFLYAKERIRTAGHAVGRLVHGQLPAHDGWIHLKLSPEDARAVYRALPDDARMAVRM